jgi:hypothetical protein
MTETEIADTTERMPPGARPRRITLKQTPVMLAPADVQALDVLAEETGRSRSALIREAVRKVWLKKGARQ